MATYNEAEDLINIGAYKAGANPEIDYAVSKIGTVNDFLKQDVNSKQSLDETLSSLTGMFEQN
jgi:flagellum-specific ATP synthase